MARACRVCTRRLGATTAPAIVCVGHTHRLVDRHVGRWHVVNLGSVSNPPAGEWRASYVLLEATSTEYRVAQRLVDYDHRPVLEALAQLKHPGAAWISAQFRNAP